jgi:hypothetical protein
MELRSFIAPKKSARWRSIRRLTAATAHAPSIAPLFVRIDILATRSTEPTALMEGHPIGRGILQMVGGLRLLYGDDEPPWAAVSGAQRRVLSTKSPLLRAPPGS